MRVYIPFNSNDFNSVFTTLSISPAGFYPQRRYSFRRSSNSILSNTDQYLVGYDKPLFHNKEFDNDYGFPILLEIDVDSPILERINNSLNLKYYLIPDTIYLTTKFKLLFRSQKEQDETFAKSLKSIESKYVRLAKSNATLFKPETYITDIPNYSSLEMNSRLSETIFKRERKLNKIMGAVLGSSIAYVNSTNKEWQEISNLMRVLNNYLSLYLNKIGENNDFEKSQSLEIIKKITKSFEDIEKLEEAIMLASDIKSDILSSFKEYKIFNISVYELIIEGLLSSNKVDLPISLRIEKLKRAINSKYNSKYPNNYIDRVNSGFNDIKESIEKRVLNSKRNNKLSAEILASPEEFDNFLVKLPAGLNSDESEYLKQAILFFIDADEIIDIEYFFINRKEILVNLANHFKNTISTFANSNERNYLISLLKSFDSLRSGFQISEIENEVLRVIAILFTSGRDLYKFIENNEKEQITNSFIYYTIWGAIYGAANIPKTLTELIIEDNINLNTLIEIYSLTIRKFYNNDLENNSITLKDPAEVILQTEFIKKEEINNGSNINSQNASKSEPSIKSEISSEAQMILSIVQNFKRIKLSYIKAEVKIFKKVTDIEEVIKKELSNKVILYTESKAKYASLKDSNQLFK